MMQDVMIHDVGCRDGLQMEKRTVPLERKIRWIESLIQAGVDVVQVGSFVNPAKVPQMADTDALFAHFSQAATRPRRTMLSCLVLNEKGLERGLASGVEMFCMGVSASETHSMKNTGMSTDEATRRVITMALTAVQLKKKIQVSVQSAFGCGFEGPVPFERVLSIVNRFLDAGLTTISLADTAGHATPDRVEHYFCQIADRRPSLTLACHFHNTYGLALANCYAAMKAGVGYIEASFAGLGGCPFTAIAGGNVCTEDLVHMLHRMGWRKDIQLEVLIELARDAAAFFGRSLPGIVYQSGAITVHA